VHGVTYLAWGYAHRNPKNTSSSHLREVPMASVAFN
jgi:hypothetical protein